MGAPTRRRVERVTSIELGGGVGAELPGDRRPRQDARFARARSQFLGLVPLSGPHVKADTVVDCRSMASARTREEARGVS